MVFSMPLLVVACCWLMMKVDDALGGIILCKKVECGARTHNIGMARLFRTSAHGMCGFVIFGDLIV